MSVRVGGIRSACIRILLTLNTLVDFSDGSKLRTLETDRVYISENLPRLQVKHRLWMKAKPIIRRFLAKNRDWQIGKPYA